MKYKVRDEDGKQYEVEEVKEANATDEDETEKPLTNTCTEDESLSADDISALKKLAGIADKLLALVDKPATEDEDEDENVEEEEIEDEDEQIEEVIDTDGPKKAKDSIKKSAGAIENKTKVVDAIEEDDIATAWAKRYGGNK